MSKALAINNDERAIEVNDEPEDDKMVDPWSAAWNHGYRELNDSEWLALAENSE